MPRTEWTEINECCCVLVITRWRNKNFPILNVTLSATWLFLVSENLLVLECPLVVDYIPLISCDITASLAGNDSKNKQIVLNYIKLI